MTPQARPRARLLLQVTTPGPQFPQDLTARLLPRATIRPRPCLTSSINSSNLLSHTNNTSSRPLHLSTRVPRGPHHTSTTSSSDSTRRRPTPRPRHHPPTIPDVLPDLLQAGSRRLSSTNNPHTSNNTTHNTNLNPQLPAPRPLRRRTSSTSP
jgi:hypothetical protein